MAINGYVFSSLMMYGVASKVNRGLIVTKKVTGFKFVTLISSRRQTIQVISEAAKERARYSASDEDLETVDCFLDFQLMGELPRRSM